LAIRSAILGLYMLAASPAVATQPPGEGVNRLVLSRWQSGGPAPLVSDVAVYEDGTVVIHGMDFVAYQARLRRRDLIRLRNDLTRSAFLAALGRMGGDDLLYGMDAQTVSFTVGNRHEAGYDMCNDEPMSAAGPLDAAVVKLVGDLNAAGTSLFGKLYNRLPLSEPCPWLHGPWDTPNWHDADAPKKPDADAPKEPAATPGGPPSSSEIEAAEAAWAAAVAAPTPPGVAKRLVQVLWFSGDREPLANDLEVFEDGTVVISDIDRGGRAAQLRRRDLNRLRYDLANSAFVSALGRLEDEGHLYDEPRVQAVGFIVGNRPTAGYHVCSDRLADPAVVKFLGHLNAAGESLFSKLFHRVPLPSPCPSMPGPQDAPKRPDAPPP
jgi:hypothetical protein